VRNANGGQLLCAASQCRLQPMRLYWLRLRKKQGPTPPPQPGGGIAVPPTYRSFCSSLARNRSASTATQARHRIVLNSGPYFRFVVVACL